MLVAVLIPTVSCWPWSWGAVEAVPARLILSTEPSGAAKSGIELLRQSATDPCIAQAFRELRVHCGNLDDDTRTRLAVEWLNCQRRAANWEAFECSQSMTTASCLSSMDKQDFTQYNLFYLKVMDVCAALQNDIFRQDIETAVANMQDAVNDATATSATSAHELKAFAEEAIDRLKIALNAEETRAAEQEHAQQAWLARMAALEARVVDLVRAESESGDLLRAKMDSVRLHMNEHEGTLGDAAFKLAEALGSLSISLEDARRSNTELLRETSENLRQHAAHIAAAQDQSARLLDIQIDTARHIGEKLTAADTSLSGVVGSASTVAGFFYQVKVRVRTTAGYLATLLILSAIQGKSPSQRLGIAVLLILCWITEMVLDSASSPLPIRLFFAVSLFAVKVLPRLRFRVFRITKPIASPNAPCPPSSIPSALLIDYIVRLRLYGPLAEMPPGLIERLTDPE